MNRHGAKLIAVVDADPWDGIPDCIPRRTGNIRSHGFHQAWAAGVDFVLSLDDDVTPLDGVDVFEEYERSFAEPAPAAPYLSVGVLVGEGIEMRGFPYENRWRPVGFQYGGWIGVPDVDAVTAISRPPLERTAFAPLVVPVPRGSALTCCAMNFAFRAELAPLAWQHSTRERWGDIWSGLYQKAALDDANMAMTVNGRASVSHERASNLWSNLESESDGMRTNEGLWESLMLSTRLHPPDPVVAWERATDRAAAHFAVTRGEEYAAEFVDRRDGWLRLFA
jgi:hypothetical protein